SPKIFSASATVAPSGSPSSLRYEYGTSPAIPTVMTSSSSASVSPPPQADRVSRAAPARATTLLVFDVLGTIKDYHPYAAPARPRLHLRSARGWSPGALFLFK